MNLNGARAGDFVRGTPQAKHCADVERQALRTRQAEEERVMGHIRAEEQRTVRPEPQT